MRREATQTEPVCLMSSATLGSFTFTSCMQSARPQRIDSEPESEKTDLGLRLWSDIELQQRKVKKITHPGRALNTGELQVDDPCHAKNGRQWCSGRWSPRTNFPTKKYKAQIHGHIRTTISMENSERVRNTPEVGLSFGE